MRKEVRGVGQRCVTTVFALAVVFQGIPSWAARHGLIFVERLTLEQARLYQRVREQRDEPPAPVLED